MFDSYLGSQGIVQDPGLWLNKGLEGRVGAEPVQVWGSEGEALSRRKLEETGNTVHRSKAPCGYSLAPRASPLIWARLRLWQQLTIFTLMLGVSSSVAGTWESCSERSPVSTTLVTRPQALGMEQGLVALGGRRARARGVGGAVRGKDSAADYMQAKSFHYRISLQP